MNRLYTNSKSALFRVFSALLLGVFSILIVAFISPEKSEWIVRYTGYYFVLASVVAFAFYVYRFCRSRLSFGIGASRNEIVFGLASVLFGAWILFIHAKLDYKIAMDDYTLAATAKSLHETREVSVTVLGNYLGDYFVPEKVIVDKRPWFYPFVVASVHDVFGYSTAHPFVVNTVVCVLFLGFVYLYGRQLAGKWAGLLSVLLWATLPLLSQNATGAGMEMLNLLMLQLLLVIAVAYLKKPDHSLEAMLSLAAVLLTYTRYESGLFVIPVALVIIIGWWRAGRVLLSWGTVCSSILLVAVALQTKIYAGNESAWELANGASLPFSADHLITNVPHALNFFFSSDDTLANSILLGLIALPAIIGFFVLLRTELKVYWHKNPAGLVLALFAIFFLIQFALVLSFHAGQLDRRFVSRYSLPFHSMIIMSTVALLGYAAQRFPKLRRVAIGGVCLYILGVTIPVNSKAIYNDSNFVVREFNWLDDLAEGQLDARSLYVDKYRVPWSLKEHTVVDTASIWERRNHLMFHLESENFPAIYVIRRAHYKNHEFVSDDAAFDQIEAGFEIELIAEKSFHPLKLTQVYEIKKLLDEVPNAESEGTE